MQIDGTLGKWNDERGFGFIVPRHGGEEIFVHISAFPKDGLRPRLGEPLSFQIEVDKAGKKRAIDVARPVRADAARVRQRGAARRLRKTRSPIGRAATLAILVALGAYGYTAYSQRFSTPSAAYSDETTAAHGSQAREDTGQRADQEATPSFRCDGRTHCSQMTSCAEAKFFLRSCPGVKMDGNHDGEPCEQQWCKDPFAR